MLHFLIHCLLLIINYCFKRHNTQLFFQERNGSEVRFIIISMFGMDHMESKGICCQGISTIIPYNDSRWCFYHGMYMNTNILWWFFTGYTVTFSALFSETWRVNNFFQSKSSFSRITESIQRSSQKTRASCNNITAIYGSYSDEFSEAAKLEAHMSSSDPCNGSSEPTEWSGVTRRNKSVRFNDVRHSPIKRCVDDIQVGV